MNQDLLIKYKDLITKGMEIENFLESKEWLELVKPILDDFIKDLSDINKIDITSDKKASIDVLGRKLAIEKIRGIEIFLKTLVGQAKNIQKIATDDE